MIDLIKFIVSNIVDAPDQIKVEESVDETGLTLVHLWVAPEDMGRVIGKNGRIISAIRELLRVKAIKQGKKVRLILEESGEAPAPEKTAPPTQ